MKLFLRDLLAHSLFAFGLLTLLVTNVPSSNQLKAEVEMGNCVKPNCAVQVTCRDVNNCTFTTGCACNTAPCQCD